MLMSCRMNGPIPATSEVRETTVMKTPKTIMLWGQENLLSSTIELILATQKGWRVINIASEGNCDALFREVDKVDPDVIIFHRDTFDKNFHLPTALFQNHPNLKVITASLASNEMEVYSKQNFMILSSSDLISAVVASTVSQQKNKDE